MASRGVDTSREVGHQGVVKGVFPSGSHTQLLHVHVMGGCNHPMAINNITPLHSSLSGLVTAVSSASVQP